jgi:deoxycytidine triphosphate deaminase
LPAKIHKDEGWIQLVFIDNREIVKVGYDGHYQNERHSDGKNA